MAMRTSPSTAMSKPSYGRARLAGMDLCTLFRCAAGPEFYSQWRAGFLECVFRDYRF
jgi:hypothetical protein